MNRILRFNRIAALAVTMLFAAATFAQQRVTNNENVTNKTTRATSASSSTSTSSKSSKVNINTASKPELEALPGVGSAIADNIIAARPFKNVADLKNVKGIGEKRFAQIAPEVTVGRKGSARDDASGSSASSTKDHATGGEGNGQSAKAKGVIPPGSPAAAGGGAAVATDPVHTGSDKPGAKEKEVSRATKNSKKSSDQ
jgi:competence ComEA-like helix-hairpin-helix protein